MKSSKEKINIQNNEKISEFDKNNFELQIEKNNCDQTMNRLLITRLSIPSINFSQLSPFNSIKTDRVYNN